MNRQIGRIALVIAGIVLAILAVGPDLGRIFGSPLHGVDYSTDYNGRVIASGPLASAAGIRVGDVWDAKRTPSKVRLFLYSAGSPHKSAVDVPMLHDGRPYVAHVRLVPESAARIQAVALRYAVQLFCMIFGTIIVLKRPSRATWAFFAFNLLMIAPSNVGYQVGPMWWRIAYYNFFMAVPEGPFYWASAFFALYVLHEGALPRWRRVMAVVLWLLFATNVASGLFIASAQMARGDTPAVAEWTYQGLSVGSFFVAVALLGVTYFEHPPAVRERLRWILAGFAIGAVAGIGVVLSPSYLGLVAIPYPAYSLLLCTQFVAPVLAVAYAVLKHRIIDVNIAVTRATVYATLSIAVVGVFALVDLFFTRALAAKDAGWIADAGIALALGFSFNSLHHNVDKLVDRILFRQRHLAEEYVASLADAVTYASDEDHVWHMVLQEPVRAFALGPARLIRASDALFSEEPCATLAALLKAGRHGKRIATPFIDMHAALAVPVFCHNELFAIVCYGPHANATDIDSDEMRLLEALCVSAGNALERLDSEALRRENEALRRIQRLPAATV